MRKVLFACLAALIVMMGTLAGFYGMRVQIDYRFREPTYIELSALAASLEETLRCTTATPELFAVYASASKRYNETMEYWRFDMEENLPRGYDKTLPRNF